MLRFLAVVMVVCFAVPATADTLSWSWTPPDSRVDGTPLTAEEIAGYHFMINGVLVVDNTVLGDVPVLLSDGLNTMDYVAAAGTICAQFATVDTEARESDFTEPEAACKESKTRPGKPFNLEVTIVPPGQAK